MKALFATAALGAALLLSTTAPGGAQGTGGAPGAMGGHMGGHMMMVRCPPGSIQLNAVGGSGEAGCATLRMMGGAGTLNIRVMGEPKDAVQPSHIHRGRCGSNGPVVIPLTNVVNGTSSTKIAMSKWTKVNKGGFYINIHQSPENIPHIVSCGNIMPMHAMM